MVNSVYKAVIMIDWLFGCLVVWLFGCLMVRTVVRTVRPVVRTVTAIRQSMSVLKESNWINVLRRQPV